MGRIVAFAMCLLLAAEVAAQGGATSASADDPGLTAVPGEEELAAMNGELVNAKTAGGGDFQGRLFGILSDRIEFLDSEGRIISLARSEIVFLEAMDGGRDPAKYFQDSASNRLILMPTGFGMEKGEFHVAAQEIVAITASYGVSEQFSVWGGVSIPGGIVNLRLSMPIAAAGGLSAGSFIGQMWIEPYVGIVLPYALASFGHTNRNLTLGLGLPFAWWSGSGFDIAGAVGAIGGKIIISPSASIVTENWIIAISEGWTWDRINMMFIPSAVFRIAGNRLSWDIGVAVPLIMVDRRKAQYEGQRLGLVFGGFAEDMVIPLPILSVTYRID